MPFLKKGDDLWFFEELFSDVSQGFRVTNVLHDEQTTDECGQLLHRLIVLETPRFGKVLILDGVVQTTEADEYLYHEPLVHCAALSCFNLPESALLIGCDGGTLREAVKYSSFRRIDVIDIDRKVIEIIKTHIPSISNGAFQDPRVFITIADGALFAKEARQLGNQYDLIVIDSPDPIGPAQSLFRTSFYLDLAAILSDGGVLIRQTGSSAFQPDEMPSNFRQMLEIFPNGDVCGFMTAVPAYIGGYFTFVAASHSRGIFAHTLEYLVERFKTLSGNTFNWYSPDMHRAAMVLTPEIQRSIDKSEFGRDLLLDLYECNPAIISSTEKLHEFAREICHVIGMKPYGDPIIPNFGFAKSKTAGPSLVQLIETSAITAHYSPHWRMVLKNIFTCSALDAESAVIFSMKFFNATQAKWRVVIRGGRLLRYEPQLFVYKTMRNGNSFDTSTEVYAHTMSKPGLYTAP